MMTEDEMRDLYVRAWNPRTDRDNQQEVGASDLSDPCDRCRAYAIAGIERDAGYLEAAHGGRNVGTAIHGRLEHNFRKAAETASFEGGDLAQLGFHYPGLEPERHLVLGELTPGRVVTSTTDLYIRSKRVVSDTKNTDLRKLAFTRDWVSLQRGEEPIFGRGHQFTVCYTPEETQAGKPVWRKLVEGVSEAVYAKEVEKAGYKMLRYSRQDHLYAKGIEDAGDVVDQLFIVFVARDSAMTLENRDSARYLDERSPRGIVAIEVQYDREFAEIIWTSAQRMAEDLDSGAATPSDYASHPLCIICEDHAKAEARIESAVTVPPAPAIDDWAVVAA